MVMQWVRSRSSPSPVTWSACRWVSTALTSLQIELAQQLAIAVDLFQHGIEDQRLAAGAAGQQIAVGAGNAVEELAKDHGDAAAFSI